MLRDFKELSERASRGDRDAVELLLERYLPALRVFLRLRIGPTLRAKEAESDIVQSTCRAILERADAFHYGGEDGFKRWLFTTAFRTLIDKSAHWRAAKRTGPQIAFDDEASAAIYRSFSSPSEHALERETRERLEHAFDALGEEEREVITLARVAGLSHREIAVAMDKSEAAVRVQLHRALLALSKHLEATA